jgi:hypothetical protein
MEERPQILQSLGRGYRADLPRFTELSLELYVGIGYVDQCDNLYFLSVDGRSPRPISASRSKSVHAYTLPIVFRAYQVASPTLPNPVPTSARYPSS